jgi:hypothetical protein
MDLHRAPPEAGPSYCHSCLDFQLACRDWLQRLLPSASRSWGDSLRFVITFALTTAFFALDMYLFQSRYLGIFPRLLHPRLP